MYDLATLTRPMLALACALGVAACGDDGGSSPIDGAGIDALPLADLHIKQLETVVTVDTAVVFTIVVENLGPTDVVDAGVRTLLPPGISVVSATCAALGSAQCGGTSTAGGASWSGLDLPVASGGSHTLTLRVVAVPTRLGAGVIGAEIIVPPTVADPDLSADSNQAMRPIERHIAQLSGAGGRVDWFRGTGTSSGAARPIAFDRAPPNMPNATEIYLANPDSQANPACISCAATFPHGLGYVGNPSWHPDGEYLVIQVENSASGHQAFNTPHWGVDNDLWLLKADGTWATRIWSAGGPRRGALHPQFSPDGNLLVFAERLATSAAGTPTQWPGMGGQDPYAGWGLRVARVDRTVLGDPQYNNIDAPFFLESERITPSEPTVQAEGSAGNGRYEPSGIGNDGALVYAYTARTATNQYVDASFRCTLSSTTTLTGATCSTPTAIAGGNPQTWDDLVQSSPDGARQTFPSSRFDTAWTPGAGVAQLRTELYAMPAGNESGAVAITSMNQTREPDNRYIVGDHRWSTDGTRIVFEVTPVAVTTSTVGKPEVWMMDVAQ